VWGWLLSDLWIQGTAAGVALTGANDYVTVAGCTILDTAGDGVDITGPAYGPWVKDNVIRNTGGDGVALRSDSGATVSGNTVVEPLLANGIADYGGAGATIVDNVIADTHELGSGITVSDAPSGSAFVPLTGSITVADNTLLRTGSAATQAGHPIGAVRVESGQVPVSGAAIEFNDDAIEDSPYSAIEIGTAGGTGQPVRGVSFDGDTISGTGTVAVQAETSGSAAFSQVTATHIGVAGSYNLSRAAGGSSFAFHLGSGNAGWSPTPVLTAYPTPDKSDAGTGASAGASHPASTGRTAPAAPGSSARPTRHPSRHAQPSAPVHTPPAATPRPTHPVTAPQPTQSVAPPAGGHPGGGHPGGGAPAPASLSAPGGSAPAGGTLRVRYATPARTMNRENWVGVYLTGQTPGRVAPIEWKVASYRKGTLSFGARGLDGPGQYQAYYFYDFGYRHLAGPVALTVTGARSTLTVSAASVAQGKDVTLSYATTAANRNADNWIGIYPAGDAAASGEWAAYQFAPGGSGHVKVSTSHLSPGQYFVYYMYDDSYRVLAAPATITVTG
jgi:hypothetical protein